MYLLWFWFYDSQVKTALYAYDGVSQFIEFETRPSSLRNSEMANSASVLRTKRIEHAIYTSKQSSQGVSQVHPLLNSTRWSVNHVFYNVDSRKKTFEFVNL